MKIIYYNDKKYYLSYEILVMKLKKHIFMFKVALRNSLS